MKKVIGIVAEGPVDHLVLKTVINRITGESHIYRHIQPEQDLLGKYGNGWKGVYRWCENNAELLPALFTEIFPALDLLIIHMDGDVARKEKEVHCHCKSTVCTGKNTESPLLCRRLKEGGCPVVLPCGDHENSPEGCRKHLNELILSLLGGYSGKEKIRKKIIVVIPCDSTDTWTASAFEEDIPAAEEIEDPWEQIISLKKDFHGIRIPGHKKSTAVYRMFLPQIADRWDTVSKRCLSAKKLEDDIRKWQEG